MNVKPDFLKKLDGTGRLPREIQINALQQLADRWHETDVHVISGPCGCGKSLLARAIQLTLGGHIIVPQNVLMDQYSETYSSVNYLKGEQWYQCHTYKGFSCADVHEMFQGAERTDKKRRCPECKYEISKQRARTESTIFNPMSLYYAKLGRAGGVSQLPVMIIDEAHSLLSMLYLMLTNTYTQSKHGFDIKKDMRSEIDFLKWARRKVESLEKLVDQWLSVNPKRALEIQREVNKLRIQITAFSEAPQEMIMIPEERRHEQTGKVDQYVTIMPLRVPQPFIRRFLGSSVKLVFLSGTLLTTDIADLVSDTPFTYYDLPSPIPKEHRPIVYRPINTANIETPIEDYVAAIEDDITRFPDRNTIIHCSYALQQQLLPFLTELYGTRLHWNTPESKNKVITAFKQQGGIFLAAGCAEGIDLPDDTCRLNIILKMEFPHLGDLGVQKRMALSDGQQWYRQQALKSTIQRYGRSTRSVTDWSMTILHDPNFSKVFNKERLSGAPIPQYFIEALAEGEKRGQMLWKPAP